MNTEQAIQLAVGYISEGNLQQARDLCMNVLAIRPDDIDALFLLGIISYQLNEYDAAIRYIEQALFTDPDFSEAYAILGNIYIRKNKLDDAINCFQKAVHLNTTSFDVYFNLGKLFKAKGLLEDAAISFQKAIEINPTASEIYDNLGGVFAEQGKLHEAFLTFSKALAVNSIDAWAYCGLGNVLGQMDSLDEAILNYNKALSINPQDALTYYNLGYALKEQGKLEEALSNFDKAIYYNPHMIKARFAHCMAQIPVIYENPESIQISCNNYRAELINLSNTITAEIEQDIEAAAEAAGIHQPFYLAYQGFNDKELQQVHGDLVCRIMSLRYPQYAKKPAMPRLLSDKDEIRIGFVSGYFYLHSNWKIPIKGWVENIDRKLFKLFGYYTGRIKDRETESARRCFSRFVEDVYSFEALCQIIKRDNLHVLIYPEIGMDPTTLKLAALRLAPAQCASWGHPDTSGLPTIDYFLSSGLMEPPGADAHYTERLIRLCNLSVYYTPLNFPLADVNREYFGLRQKSVLYLCCQSLFKYLPQYDEIYPRIAKEVGDCQFLFISHKSSYITEQFHSRIRQAFDQFGLKADDYVVFLPRLDANQYDTINSLSDIYLDSIGWSGCNSTFEAIAKNLPIITFPGELMRGRHSAAILNMMGITDTIASTIDEYESLAVKLGNDPDLRRNISGRIADNKHRVYRDRTCITALQDFIKKVVTGYF